MCALRVTIIQEPSNHTFVFFKQTDQMDKIDKGQLSLWVNSPARALAAALLEGTLGQLLDKPLELV